MNLFFEKLTIKNFMSFKNQEFDFSNYSGLTLVYGKNHDVENSKNGVGKSSLFTALLYALFGELHYNIKNENLKNKYVTDDNEMSVEIILTVNNRNRYRIRRLLDGKYSKHSVLFLDEIDSTGKVIRDLRKSTIAETDLYIQRHILCCDISIFLRTVFLSAEQNYNFFKLNAAGKREFIETIFNTMIYNDMYKAIHQDVLRHKNNIDAAQNKLIVLNANHEKYEGLIEKFDKENCALLEKAKSELSELQSRKDNFNTTKNEKYLLFENAQTKTKELDSHIEKMNIRRSRILEKYDTISNRIIDLKNTLHSIDTQMRHDNKIIDTHRNIINQLCEKCTEVFKTYYNIKQTEQKIQELVATRETLVLDIEKHDKIKTTLHNSMSDVDKQISAATTEIFKLNAVLIEYEKDANELDAMISETERRINDIIIKENPYTSLRDSNLVKIEEEKARIKESYSTHDKLAIAESIVSSTGLRKFVIHDLLEILNTKIEFYLKRLGARFKCIMDESLTCEFVSENGSKFEYHNFSSGEQMRLMIAACFAFKDFAELKNGFQSNILVVDEFIDSGLDDAAVHSIIEILREYSKIGMQSVYIISHRVSKETEASIFDSIIEVEKTNNISTANFITG